MGRLRNIGRLRAGGNNLSAAITALFAAGEQGAWYDPSDLSTQFQDSAGTTPVTATGQPVGLVLDKHAALGADIVDTANTTAAWSTITGTHTIEQVGDAVKITCTSTGIAQCALSASGGLTTNLVIGQFYKIQYQARVETTPVNTSFTSISTGPAAQTISSTSYEDKSGWLTFSATSSGLRVTLDTGEVAWVRGIAVMPSTGNHLIQGTTGSRPILQQVAGYAEKGDGLDDFMATIAGGGGTAGFFYCAAINASALGANQTLWADTGTNTGYRVRLNAANNLELAAGNGTAFTTAASAAAVSSSTTYVVTAWHDGVNLNCQINLGAVASAAFGAATAGTAAFTVGSSNGGASGFFNGYIFSEVYRKDSGLTSAQRLQVQQYIATKAGISI